jgi:hypothetical protein
MTDIVKKLREFESFLKDPKPGEHVIKSDIFDEAADEVERLREALQKIAAIDTEKITSALGSGIATKLWVKLNECVELSREALGEKK